MPDRPADRSTASPRAGRGPKRKPYERPRILCREPLEVVAVACEPQPPGKPDILACASPQS